MRQCLSGRWGTWAIQPLLPLTGTGMLGKAPPEQRGAMSGGGAAQYNREGPWEYGGLTPGMGSGVG